MLKRRQRVINRRSAIMRFESSLRMGDWPTVLERLSRDNTLNTMFFSGVAPLAYYLAHAGPHELLVDFLVTGPSLDCLSADGDRIEHILAASLSIHELPSIQKTLAQSARDLDWSVRNKKGEAPLDLACAKNRDAGMAHYLLTQGAPVGDAHTALAGILWQHDDALFRAGLAHGVDPRAVHPKRGSLWHTLASMPAVFAEKADMLADLGIPQPVMPGIGSPLDVGLRSLSLWQDVVDSCQDMSALFRYLQGPPTHISAYLGFLMSDARAEFSELLARYPLGAGAGEALWNGLLKMDAEGLATRGDALLQRGFEPTPAQWTRIKSKLKRGRTEFSPHALRAWLSDAGSIQIPWSLPWVCAWKDPALVQEWLAQQGHPALRNLLVSTGMLASTPSDQWLALLRPLYQAENRRQKKERGLGQPISV